MESNNIEYINEEAVIEALTLNCEIDNYGSKAYYNKEGELHRVHGPAVIHKDGYKAWYKNGKWHREDGPAIIFVDGREAYYINDNWMSKKDFKKRQKKNGIDPTE